MAHRLHFQLKLVFLHGREERERIYLLVKVSTETTITRGGKHRYSTRRNGQFVYLVARKVMNNTHMRSTYEWQSV
jgi:hypothetical protein